MAKYVEPKSDIASFLLFESKTVACPFISSKNSMTLSTLVIRSMFWLDPDATISLFESSTGPSISFLMKMPPFCSWFSKIYLVISSSTKAWSRNFPLFWDLSWNDFWKIFDKRTFLLELLEPFSKLKIFWSIGLLPLFKSDSAWMYLSIISNLLLAWTLRRAY